jgi:hypothetical protein
LKRKYQLLRFGRAYLNKTGDLAVFLVSGSKEDGYTFLASTAHRSFFLTDLHLQSRVVEAGNWKEFHPQMWTAVCGFHSAAMTVKLPQKSGEPAVVDFY